MHGGYVGFGMLDALVPAVFTSPTPDQMYEAAKVSMEGRAFFL